MSETRVVHVELGARGYDIHIGTGLIGRGGEHLAPLATRAGVVVVTDETVARLHLPALERSLDGAGIPHKAVILPPGEATKDFTHFARLCEDILALGIERRTLLVALGGGVVGDIAGFAAASLLRGLAYAQIPTTLLAQVDSSVGGKTAINSAHGKNLVGAFHQPVLVLADVAALATLARRELLAGYAEVLKYGLIRDREFFEWLERDSPALLAGDPAALARAVAESCAHKAAVVGADERETGERQLLNFGHTFAHALEAETGFGPELLHGEAVAAGMALAFDFSVRLGHATAQTAHRVRRHLAGAGLPTGLGAVKGKRPDPDRLLQHMRRDKKVSDGRLTFILAREIGDAFVARDVPEAEVRDFLAAAASS
ncbi:MAG TPA: 3-dehydroquinate synthase [Stellaceae bacterium]|nr:3-dehydroquinate synthase [Stellaceae bacterium]